VVVVAFDVLVAVVAADAADAVDAADVLAVADAADVAAFLRDDPVTHLTAPNHLPSVGATWAVHVPVRSSFGSKGLA
jgi:hypothetical protein